MLKNEMSILDHICKWRTELMGIAIVWVAMFHSFLVWPEPWAILKNTGYAGVDIFLLLSGVGMYHSLSKCNDIGNFYKKRAMRILPSYLPFILLWFVWRAKSELMNPIDILKMVFGNLFMTGYFKDVHLQFNWYVQIICWLYLLSPVLYQLIIRCKNSFQKVGIVLIGFGMGIPYLYDIDHLMGVSRIPIFLIGMIWAHENHTRKAEEVAPAKKSLLRIGVIVLSLVGIMLFLWYYKRDVNMLWLYGLWWYPFILITPGLCYVLSMIMDFFAKFKVLKFLLVPFKYIGLASFEIYLVHIDIFKWIMNVGTGVTNLHWWGIIASVCVLGILYHYCIMGITKGSKYLKAKILK